MCTGQARTRAPSLWRRSMHTVYRGTDLELFEPCASQQLVRVGLYTGLVERFATGVFFSAKDTGFLIEYARDESDKVHLFVEAPGRSRVEIKPAFIGRPLAIDATRLAGLMPCKELPDAEARKCGDNDRSFSIWSATRPTHALRTGHRSFALRRHPPESYLWMHPSSTAELVKLSKFTSAARRSPPW